jgi:hypothetical protein
MPAFNTETADKIANNIRALYQRRAAVGDLFFTDEEYLQMFVPAQMRDLFREVAPLAVKITSRVRINLSQLGAHQAVIMFWGDNVPLMPRGFAIQPDAPKELVQRFHEWIENGGDVSRDFGRVMTVFRELNVNHSRVSMRYYWPMILALCSESDATKPVVKELQELRTPTALKPLLPGLSKALRQTAATVATARLLPTDIETSYPSTGVTISVVNGQEYKEDFGTFMGLS